MAIQLSARNQLKAKVKSVKLGTVMAEVVVEWSECAQHDTVRLLERVFFTWRFN